MLFAYIDFETSQALTETLSECELCQ